MSSSLPSSSPLSSAVHAVRIRRASDRRTPGYAACATLIACLLAGLGASPAHAAPSPDASVDQPSGGTIHVCVDVRGLREFRDTPCAPHQRSLRAIPFRNAPIDTTSQARSSETARETERRRAAAQDRTVRTSAARAASAARRAPDGCARAKTRRDEAHAHAPSGLSFDQLRRLDRDVWVECPNG